MAWNDPMSMTLGNPSAGWGVADPFANSGAGWGMNPYQQQGGALVDPNQSGAAREIRRDLIRPYYVSRCGIEPITIQCSANFATRNSVIIISSLSSPTTLPSFLSLLRSHSFARISSRAQTTTTCKQSFPLPPSLPRYISYFLQSVNYHDYFFCI